MVCIVIDPESERSLPLGFPLNKQLWMVIWMNESLRLAAIASQLIGFIIIFLMRTYEVDVVWQGIVLMLMLLSALAIWLVKRYQKNKKLLEKKQSK